MTREEIERLEGRELDYWVSRLVFGVSQDEVRHLYEREADAARDCEWWQQVLRLQDWDVKVRIARA